MYIIKKYDIKLKFLRTENRLSFWRVTARIDHVRKSYFFCLKTVTSIDFFLLEKIVTVSTTF